MEDDDHREHDGIVHHNPCTPVHSFTRRNVVPVGLLPRLRGEVLPPEHEVKQTWTQHRSQR